MYARGIEPKTSSTLYSKSSKLNGTKPEYPPTAITLTQAIFGRIQQMRRAQVRPLQGLARIWSKSWISRQKVQGGPLQKKWAKVVH
jgi:hypothetical protein